MKKKSDKKNIFDEIIMLIVENKKKDSERIEILCRLLTLFWWTQKKISHDDIIECLMVLKKDYEKK